MEKIKNIFGKILLVTVLGLYYLPTIHAVSVGVVVAETQQQTISSCIAHCLEQSIATDEQKKPSDIVDWDAFVLPELCNSSLESTYIHDLYQAGSSVNTNSQGYCTLIGIVKNIN